MNFSIHALSDVQTKDIGEGTRIWQFCVILQGAKIGMNCNICSHCFIENNVCVGNNVTIKCGVQLWDGVKVGNNVFIGPNATFCNDKHPISRNNTYKCLTTIIEDDVSIGVNATILPGIKLGLGEYVTDNPEQFLQCMTHAWNDREKIIEIETSGMLRLREQMDFYLDQLAEKIAKSMLKPSQNWIAFKKMQIIDYFRYLF